MIETMGSSAPVGPSSEPWAQRLAKRLAARRVPDDALPDQAIAAAVGMLWSLFDAAMAEANGALEQAGVRERIRVQRRPSDRCYFLETEGSAPRRIRIAINVRATGREIAGGALLGESQSRAGAFLVPSFAGGEAQWVVQGVGTPLRAYIVRDLFLSIFADDPVATHRLSPLSGSEFFANPWL